MRSSRLRVCVGLLLAAFVVVELLILLDIAWWLTLDYYDGFDYLRNARLLAEQSGSSVAVEYTWRRPPLVPLMQSLTYPVGSGASAPLVGLRAAHLLAWTLSVAALCAIYQLLKIAYDRTYALLGVFLVAANPIFLHHVPFAMVDIPAMLLTVLTLGSYLRARATGSASGALLCGAALAAAMSTKYSLILLLPCLLLCELAEALGRVDKARAGLLRALLSRRTMLIFGSALGLWYGLHLAIYVRLEGLEAGALPHLFRTLLGGFEVVQAVVWDDPRTEYLQELFQVSPIALIGCGFLGAILSIRGMRPQDRLHLIWVVFFLSVMSLGIGSKSSRYLLPVLPSLVYLQLRGVEWCHSMLVGLGGEGRTWLFAGRIPGTVGLVLGFGAIVWLPVVQATQQLLHFEDPIYRSAFIERTMRHIRDRSSKDSPIYWRGHFFSLYPAQPVFFPHDETFYFYHLGPPALEYLLNRPVLWWPHRGPLGERQLVETLDRNAVVVDSLPLLHLTHRADLLPAVPAPLGLIFVERRSFVRQPRPEDSIGEEGEDAPLVLREKSHPDQSVRLSRTSAGFEMPDEFAQAGWSAYYRPTARARPLRVRGTIPRRPLGIELVRLHRERLGFRQGGENEPRRVETRPPDFAPQRPSGS